MKKANLSKASLRDTDLGGADLGGADLSKADLRGVNVCGANLREPDLGAMGLTEVTLRGRHQSLAGLVLASRLLDHLIGFVDPRFQVITL